MADSMESVTRASVDISTQEPEAAAPGAGSKSFTVTVNKKVAYALALVVVLALGALGVAARGGGFLAVSGALGALSAADR